MNSHQDSELDPKDSAGSSSKVKVALRIRPMVNKELIEGALKCIETLPQTSQIVIGKDKTFTFDRIFDESSTQEEIYTTFASDLVMGCFSGYNATILAYGQTGSGKTYTMGSAIPLKPEDTGIISRVIREICNEIELRKSKSEFLIKVTYLEIYNEEIYDLLDQNITTSARNKLGRPNSSINIREEKDGSISIYGINEEKVGTYEEMMACLERGSLHRSTASTLMNEVSSRSHAIFTITLEQHCLDDLYKPKTPTRQPLNISKTAPIDSSTNGFMTAKFHFVDLAGSERIKKTGASGNVMREGININRGLLVLGNVISALTDTTSKSIHVPYRESKLTRILQDSLGGNSLTGMIACVSPAESNYEESLNTIKYANRARNIQNTPHINRDPQTALISQLKQQIFELQNENTSLKQLLSKSDIKWEGKTPPSSRLSISPMVNGKSSIETEQEDIRNLKIQLIQMEKLNKKMQSEALNKQKSLNELEISLYTITKERDMLRLYNEKHNEGNPKPNMMTDDLQNRMSIIESYRLEIEKMKQELQKKEEFTRELQLEYEQLLISSRKDQDMLLEKIRLLALYQKHIEKLERERARVEGGGKEGERGQELEGSIQEVVNEDDEEEWLEMEKELVSMRNSAEDELNTMSGAIKEKEELLKNITENNLELERDLLDVMKNQYHQKISNLEGELNVLVGEVRRMEGQRDKAILQLNHNSNSKEADDKNRVIMINYKNKISQLENQLKDFRKKEKEQQNLQRLVQNQQNKINELANEIKTIKQQKLQLNRKYREELEKLDKFKAVRNKEKQDWKKKEIEKEQQISKLKTEKEKLNTLMRKKDEEIINNKKSQELFRNLCNKDFKQAENKFSNFASFLDPRNQNKRYPTRKTSKMIEEKGGLGMEFDGADENIMVALETLQEKILEILELDQKILSEEGELRRTETDLEHEMKKLSEFLFQKEKMSMENGRDFEEEDTLRRRKNEIDVQINELYMRIENLEDKIVFLSGKLKEMRKKSEKNGGVSDLFSHFLHFERNNNNKGLLRGVMERWGDLLKEMIKMQEELKRKTLELKEMAGKISQMEIKYNMAESTFHQNLNRLTQEYEEKHLKMLQQQDLYNVLKESKDFPNKEVIKANEGKGKAKNDMMEIENGSNPIQINSKSNHHEIKLVSFKEKRQLIRQEKLKDNPIKNNPETGKPDISKLKELDAIKPKSPSKKRDFQGVGISPNENLVPLKEKVEKKRDSGGQMNFNNFFPDFKDFSTCGRAFLDLKVEENASFRCLYQQNTANSSIESLKLMDKMLFIGHLNGVQIMDLECNKVINEWRLDSSELKLNTLTINREKGLLIYSYENYIEVRDLYTYQKIESLKARTPVIKDLVCHDYMMFSGGKGSISKGGLLLWDLRKMSWTKENEKNADISKLLIKDRVLYYGGKEKIIKRLSIDTGLNIYPYVQKHTDSILALAGLKDHIISGARDKTIKLWNANNFIENCTDSANFEQNSAKSLETSFCYSDVFYSGGTDGKLGIWGLSSEKIRKIYEIEAHQSTINAIVESNYNNENVLITGSSDEILKIWKPGEEVIGLISENV